MDEKRTENHCFIKWWRKDEGVVDIELLDTFFDTAKAGDRFDGFELLDMEDMWVIVKRQCLGWVERTVQNDDEVLIWERVDSTGGKRRINCQFAPEFLIKVFEVETGGHFDEE